MNITADAMRQINVKNVLIQSEIKSIIRAFESEILEASKSGAMQVVVGVPTNFNVNMKNSEAQTIIYHSLIEELEKNGFSVRISLSASAVTFCIKWGNTGKSESELKNMRNIISSKLIGKKRLTDGKKNAPTYKLRDRLRHTGKSDEKIRDRSDIRTATAGGRGGERGSRPRIDDRDSSAPEFEDEYNVEQAKIEVAKHIERVMKKDTLRF